MLTESGTVPVTPAGHKSRIRVVDLETGGNGPNDVCEIGWQDVVLGHDGAWQVDEERGSLLVNPGRPISPETMAIHHILDAEVATAPFWKEVASSVLRPEGGVLALAAHRAAFEQRYCTPRYTGGADWICTWKSALRLWPELPRFSNQMLRYLRMPEGLVHSIGLPAHRAMPDAYVTAHHLRDMLNETTSEQLVAWSKEPGLLPRVPSGTERGKGWDRVDIETLRGFARDRDTDVRFSAETELRRRGNAGDVGVVESEQGTLL
ncbi:DNA polymerase III subunit epsilon [Rhizobium laguerreae]|nr:DNA polymerase III subunit epsilon [Rhizobium laguerreae]